MSRGKDNGCEDLGASHCVRILYETDRTNERVSWMAGHDYMAVTA